MLFRPLIVTAILLQAVLGNICMMPMAFAHDAETLREEPMTMLMTPAFPMTPANLSAYEEPVPHGCNGHCMSDTLVTTTVVASPDLSTVASIVPSPYVAAKQCVRHTAVLPTALSPPIALHIATTVLRL